MSITSEDRKPVTGRVAAVRRLLAKDSVRPMRFGEVAVALGYIRDSQVLAALAIQRLDRAHGRPHRRVGEILVAQGSMTHSQVSLVLDSMVKHTFKRSSAPLGVS